MVEFKSNPLLPSVGISTILTQMMSSVCEGTSPGAEIQPRLKKTAPAPAGTIPSIMTTKTKKLSALVCHDIFFHDINCEGALNIGQGFPE
jgi:hypothetical protein